MISYRAKEILKNDIVYVVRKDIVRRYYKIGDFYFQADSLYTKDDVLSSDEYVEFRNQDDAYFSKYEYILTHKGNIHRYTIPDHIRLRLEEKYPEYFV